jgi:chromosome segregation ATPase
MDITFEEIKQILAETAAAQKVHATQLAKLEIKLTTQTEGLKQQTEGLKQQTEGLKQQTEGLKQQTEDLKQKLAIEKAELEIKIASEKAELEKQMAFEKTDLEKTIKQTKKQLGELGNKLGSFAEGLAYPTVERIMLQQLGMSIVSQNLKVEKGEDSLEIDAFGYTNGTINKVTVGEIKSHFREENIEQIERTCCKIHEFMPDHKGKEVNGMVIFVKGDKIAIQKAIKKGIYVVQANDENFKLLTPPKFVARDFSKP